MRRTLFVLLLSVLLTASLRADEAPAGGFRAPPQVTGRYEQIQGQRVLTLWGSPRQRGFAQGYLLGEQVVAGIAHDFERIPFMCW